MKISMGLSIWKMKGVNTLCRDVLVWGKCIAVAMCLVKE